MDFEIVASGLQFPEGPVALADGSVLLVEIRSAHLTRITPDQRTEHIADLGGGPNGAAIGPDGAVYVTNNGGFAWQDLGNGTMRPAGIAPGYAGGCIQRVDLASGEVTTLYTACDGRGLRGPNDLVFDSQGGFYFTDHGKWTREAQDWGALYHAQPDGSRISRLRDGLLTPNGVGLSPDGTTVYVAESRTARLWAFDVLSPGVVAPPPDEWLCGRLLWNGRGRQLFDSLAVEAGGNICIGSIVDGGITTVSPDGTALEHLPLPAAMVTNLCFAGADRRTALVTASDTGQLLKLRWPRSGLALNFDA